MDHADFACTWAITYAEFLPIWLIAALLVMTPAWIEIRRATWCVVMAMTETVATTVVARMSETVVAAQSVHLGMSASVSSPGLAKVMRVLGHLSADRMYWLHAVTNLRLFETALPPTVPGIPVHPPVYNTPRPLAGAHLAAERCFVDHVRVL